jgi:hypothetical protein
MNNIKTNYYNINYPKYKNDDSEIILEIYRGKLYNILLKKFISSCINNLNESVFSNKKNYFRTIVNLLASWLFTLYIEYDFLEDSFFPKNHKNYDLLKETLKNYTSLYNIDNVEDKINNIINNLDNTYIYILNLLSEYKKTTFYKENKNKIILNKTIITQKRNNNEILFYKFNIIFNCNIYINSSRLKNIINNIIIPIETYNKMKNKYKGEETKMDIYIWIILFRYQILGSNNNQLAVLPNVLDKMKNDINLNFECFASAINSNTEHYCSLYYDVEKYFGSIGNFFNIDILEGIVSFNPPYQSNVIEYGINKILSILENTNNKISFLITIPIWDTYGKNIMEEQQSKNNNDNIDYGDFDIMSKIFNSKFYYGKLMISKNDFTYIDHNFYLFKNKTIQNTYIIILSNYNNNYIDIIKNYNFYL